MVNALQSLDERDFYVGRGKKGPLLCTRVNGLVISLFYSNDCVHCKQLVPEFKRLSRAIHGAKFAMINLKTNMNVARMASNTIAPIKFVPLIMVHIRNKPYVQYAGERTFDALKEFVIKVADSIKRKRVGRFVKNLRDQPVNQGRAIPLYTVGRPVQGDCEDGVCYLDFSTAYIDGQGQTNTQDVKRHHTYNAAYGQG
ncbi:MAG: hypothetical protein JKX76_02740 [Colwellia sp.]|nr:hypothetical protein [Colwellia sp.]